MSLPTTPLKFPLEGKPVDKDGNWTPIWHRAMQGLFNRAGGDVSPSNAQLAAAIATNVTGPGSSVDGDVVLFNGPTGYSIKDSGIQITALALLASPTFTGIPKAPTASPGTSTTQIATTAFVGSAGFGNVSGPGSSTNNDVALFSGSTGKLIADSGVQLSALAPLASPTFTGTPAAPTASAGTNTTQLATTAFVQGIASGRLLNTQTFTASGTYTPTTGTTRILVKGQGAGAAGGGSSITAAGQVSAGSGGGAGGIGETFLTSGFSGATVTIGAGGAGVAGAAGGNGGASSFGAFLSLPGGAGGGFGAAATAIASFGGVGGVATGGTILNASGARGSSSGGSFAAVVVISGAGANSLYGAGGRAQPTGGGGGVGEAGSGFGSGGSGAVAVGAVGAAAAGGAGAGGIIVIYEYT